MQSFWVRAAVGVALVWMVVILLALPSHVSGGAPVVIALLLPVAILAVTISMLSGWLHAASERAAAAARAESQERLAASERHFAIAFEACPLPYAMMRMRDHRFIAVNDAFATFVGYRRDEFFFNEREYIEIYTDAGERELVR